MSTFIKASCPECGEFEFAVEDITVIADRKDDRLAFYNFICPNPEHAARISKPAEPRIIDMLLATGCGLTQKDLDASKDAVENATLSESLQMPTVDQLTSFEADMEDPTFRVTVEDILGSRPD